MEAAKNSVINRSYISRVPTGSTYNYMQKGPSTRPGMTYSYAIKMKGNADHELIQ